MASLPVLLMSYLTLNMATCHIRHKLAKVSAMFTTISPSLLYLERCNNQSRINESSSLAYLNSVSIISSRRSQHAL